ncbi:hypothetical protein ACHMW6_33560 [Pseudoduganella sp. UC29_106]|uniref:hypothetical protein n=1 Tax=Pseudoduganella sp. UC29_106 TaxID=3374553 RepID=UPI0037568E58
MKFIATCDAQLPPLAWCAWTSDAGGTVSLLHGRWVEVGEHFFVEGAWSGDYAAARPDLSELAFGSAGVIADGVLTFVSSTATTDYLYYRDSAEGLIVSNSLPFLLARLDELLDARCAHYGAICESITQGIDAYQAEIPTAHGTVRRLMFRNLVWDGAAVRLVDKPSGKPFSNYEEYAAYLRGQYAAVAANARAAERKQPLRILSTQSRGYDSTAINALAAPFGVDKVFTISKGKGKDSFAEGDAAVQVNDDGSEIAAILKMPCVALERRQFEEGLLDEYLYFAGITNCEDLNFAGMMTHIDQPSLLLTGTLGEIYYNRRKHEDMFGPGKIGPELRRGDIGGGHGMGEVRLQVGLVQAPLIYAGARQRESIVAITESSAMDPWRLNTSYDRPIARRLAEEAGIPREAFGQKKMASTVVYSRPTFPVESGLSAEFRSWLVQQGLLRRWQIALLPLVHWLNARIWFASPSKYLPLYYFKRAYLRFRGRHLPMVWQHLDSALYCFCVNRRKMDYQTGNLKDYR